MSYPNLTLQIIDQHKTPSTGFYVITPTVAAAVLKDRNLGNRNLALAKATQAAHDVAHGEFVLNGESIIFGNDGKLIDGQHRLDAVSKSGKSITSVVVMGMDPVVAETVDRGKSRSVRDVLVRRGIPNGNELAAVGRHLLGYYAGDGTGFGRTGEYSDAEILDWIDNNPRAHTLTTWGVALKTPLLGLAAASHIAMTRGILEPKYGAPAVTNFLERVAYGDNISKTHPAFVVRRKLQAERASLAKTNKRISTLVAVEIMMRGFLAFHHNRQLTTLQVRGELPTINKTARAANTTALPPSGSEALSIL